MTRLTEDEKLQREARWDKQVVGVRDYLELVTNNIEDLSSLTGISVEHMRKRISEMRDGMSNKKFSRELMSALYHEVSASGYGSYWLKEILACLIIRDSYIIECGTNYFKHLFEYHNKWKPFVQTYSFDDDKWLSPEDGLPKESSESKAAVLWRRNTKFAKKAKTKPKPPIADPEVLSPKPDPEGAEERRLRGIAFRKAEAEALEEAQRSLIE